MRAFLFLTTAMTFGCSATGKSEGTTGNGGVGGCGYAESSDIPDELDGIPGDGHICEDATLYDEYSEFQVYTLFYAGEFDIDDCGAVTGNETWQIFPTPVLQDGGMDDCEVVYDVTGSKGEPGEHGDFRLTMTAEVNEETTTCAVLGGHPIYEGYEKFDLVYDVDVDPGSGGSAFYFESGSLLGNGYGNLSHVNYLTDSSCGFYTVAF